MLRNIFQSKFAVFRKPIEIWKGISASTQRYYTDNDVSQQTEGEKHILSVLKVKFPSAREINVQDISGGCGAMFEIQIEAEEFRGKRTVMQHRMVNDALKEEIKDMHGLRIVTQIPS